jgi:hypothetical protein
LGQDRCSQESATLGGSRPFHKELRWSPGGARAPAWLLSHCQPSEQPRGAVHSCNGLSLLPCPGVCEDFKGVCSYLPHLCAFADWEFPKSLKVYEEKEQGESVKETLKVV